MSVAKRAGANHGAGEGATARSVVRDFRFRPGCTSVQLERYQNRVGWWLGSKPMTPHFSGRL